MTSSDAGHDVKCKRTIVSAAFHRNAELLRDGRFKYPQSRFSEIQHVGPKMSETGANPRDKVPLIGAPWGTGTEQIRSGHEKSAC